MTTQLALRNTQTHGLSPSGDATWYDMLAVVGTPGTGDFGAAQDTGVVNTQASGTEIQFTKTAGGSTFAFLSRPAPAGGFTLSAFTCSLWLRESSMSANIGGRVRLYKRTAAGSIVEMGGGPWDIPNAEVSFSALTEYASGTLTPTTNNVLAENDRILLRVYICNEGTMGGGYTGTLAWNEAAAGTGDSFLQLAETVEFKSPLVSLGNLRGSARGLARATTARLLGLVGRDADRSMARVAPTARRGLVGLDADRSAARAAVGVVRNGAAVGSARAQGRVVLASPGFDDFRQAIIDGLSAVLAGHATNLALVQGTTILQRWDVADGTDFGTVDLAVEADTIAAITDPDDLRLRVTSQGATGRTVVSLAKLWRGVGGGEETHGWNAEVRDKLPVTAVVRTSDTVVTITLPAEPGYDIDAQETIEVTVPAEALASGGPLVATPTFTIDAEVASLTGLGAGRSAGQIGLRVLRPMAMGGAASATGRITFGRLRAGAVTGAAHSLGRLAATIRRPLTLRGATRASGRATASAIWSLASPRSGSHSLAVLGLGVRRPQTARTALHGLARVTLSLAAALRQGTGRAASRTMAAWTVTRRRGVPAIGTGRAVGRIAVAAVRALVSTGAGHGLSLAGLGAIRPQLARGAAHGLARLSIGLTTALRSITGRGGSRSIARLAATRWRGLGVTGGVAGTAARVVLSARRAVSLRTTAHAVAAVGLGATRRLTSRALGHGVGRVTLTGYTPLQPGSGKGASRAVGRLTIARLRAGTGRAFCHGLTRTVVGRRRLVAGAGAARGLTGVAAGARRAGSGTSHGRSLAAAITSARWAAQAAGAARAVGRVGLGFTRFATAAGSAHALARVLAHTAAHTAPITDDESGLRYQTADASGLVYQIDDASGVRYEALALHPAWTWED